MAIAHYQKRISGPLLNRIDVHVEVPRVDYEKLADKRNVENSQLQKRTSQSFYKGRCDFLKIPWCPLYMVMRLLLSACADTGSENDCSHYVELNRRYANRATRE